MPTRLAVRVTATNLSQLYVGRGKWRDIRRLRATFDFITGDVQTDFGYGE